ncbi:MAG: YhcH/YjgK/YiaL family protein [Elusimicrobiota bacterium]|nr:YhcH/YjgK/YiaL family protein [Elusimicrobiota bacterium]
MIVSDLEHIERQAFVTPGLEKALEFLRRPGAGALPDGKYEIDGERTFAIVQRYETITPAAPNFEAHRKYLDVQFMASGAEVIGWAPLGGMAVTEVYDGGKDVCFGAVPAGGWTPVRLEAGQLAVLYPEDAHSPRLAAGAPAPVTKIVVKVSVQL